VNLRYVALPGADRDIDEIAEYYAEQANEEIVVRFLVSFENAVAFLRANPAAGALRFTSRRRLAGLRAWPVPGFEDVRIYYLHNRRTLRIVRVLHGKRDTAKILGGKRH
jgi:plasmid stabilization system protein ParE